MKENPIVKSIAAVSVGIVQSTPLLDLRYDEDASADVDLNVVMTSEHEYVELQGTGEQITFDQVALSNMLDLARQGITQLTGLQQNAITSGS